MLKKVDDAPGRPGERPSTEFDEALSPEDWLVCARCEHGVTREAWAIPVNGDHLHTVFNPAGHLFRVRCFSNAPGAAVAGEPTDHFTWFKGYVWRFALCAGCGEHLGWVYDGDAGDRFFGLVAPKLRAGGNGSNRP